MSCAHFDGVRVGAPVRLKTCTRASGIPAEHAASGPQPIPAGHYDGR
jgi:hypothetical protein